MLREHFLLAVLLVSWSDVTSATTSAPSTSAGPVAAAGDETSCARRELQRMAAVVDNLLRDNADLRRALTEIQTTLLRYVTSGHDVTPQPPGNVSCGGATYIRWGRTSCPPEAERVYEGYVGGSYYRHEGAATDLLCLPKTPEHVATTLNQSVAFVYGAEYQTFNNTWPNHDQDVPCALCRSPTRSSASMIPARTSCYADFHLEYQGLLMAGKYDHKAGSQYVCVDRSPENVAGGQTDFNGALLHFTTISCGSLKCPPYIEGRIVACVVCSK